MYEFVPLTKKEIRALRIKFGVPKPKKESLRWRIRSWFRMRMFIIFNI